MTKEQRSAWRKANPELHAAEQKDFYAKHRKKIRKRQNRNRRKVSVRYITHRHSRRTRLTQAGGSFTFAEWKALCSRYGNICLCCKKKKKLTADHVIPVSKGGTSNIENIQPLCQSCNSRKRVGTTDFRKFSRTILAGKRSA